MASRCPGRAVAARRRPWLLVLLGACAGHAGGTATPAPADGVHRVAVRIEFEPALAGPAELEVAHECGERFTVRVLPTGVDLRLPPGPVVLALHHAGGRRECVLGVVPGMPAFVWRLAN